MPATRLTEANRRTVKNFDPHATVTATPPRPKAVCKHCGSPVSADSTYCFACSTDISRKNLREAAKLGRIVTHSDKAEALRSATQRRQAIARYSWRPTDQPGWLTGNTYKNVIQPRLKEFTIRAIATAILVSEPYAAKIRNGDSIPHPRHWIPLAKLTGYRA